MNNYNFQNPNTQCFAYDKELNRCRVLIEMVCKNKKCPFYKTELEYLEGLRKLEEAERREFN